MTVEVFAPAKINLTLHITGQRADGYHLLDSLVVFADVGDTIRVSAGDSLTLDVTGPKSASVPVNDENLMIKAARLFGCQKGAALELVKDLPVASGIGGGSTDAAATLLALSDLWKMPLPDMNAIASLGADIPVCLSATPSRMGGTGEALASFKLPAVHIVLVNPNIAVRTAAVFSALAEKQNAPMPDLPDWSNTRAFCAWLSDQRNDLEGAALRIAPEIAGVLDCVRATAGCLFARMSGSGATCFGLYENAESANAAAKKIQRSKKNWWVVSACTWQRAN